MKSWNQTLWPATENTFSTLPIPYWNDSSSPYSSLGFYFLTRRTGWNSRSSIYLSNTFSSSFDYSTSNTIGSNLRFGYNNMMPVYKSNLLYRLGFMMSISACTRILLSLYTSSSKNSICNRSSGRNNILLSLNAANCKHYYLMHILFNTS